MRRAGGRLRDDAQDSADRRCRNRTAGRTADGRSREKAARAPPEPPGGAPASVPAFDSGSVLEGEVVFSSLSVLRTTRLLDQRAGGKGRPSPARPRGGESVSADCGDGVGTNAGPRRTPCSGKPTRGAQGHHETRSFPWACLLLRPSLRALLIHLSGLPLSQALSKSRYPINEVQN